MKTTNPSNAAAAYAVSTDSSGCLKLVINPLWGLFSHKGDSLHDFYGVFTMCTALFEIRHKPSGICYPCYGYTHIYREADGNPEQCGMELAKILAKYGDNWNGEQIATDLLHCSKLNKPIWAEHGHEFFRYSIDCETKTVKLFVKQWVGIEDKSYDTSYLKTRYLKRVPKELLAFFGLSA
ncbi:MAG: hypothetical protein IJ780_06965 [Neisseriaceae bacterium]|nr:hypothetical protein [Neisseriaceae bacterium]